MPLAGLVMWTTTAHLTESARGSSAPGGGVGRLSTTNLKKSEDKLCPVWPRLQTKT